jgi:hypothetical protein
MLAFGTKQTFTDFLSRKFFFAKIKVDVGVCSTSATEDGVVPD